jgi:hypothetical protein
MILASLATIHAPCPTIEKNTNSPSGLSLPTLHATGTFAVFPIPHK